MMNEFFSNFWGLNLAVFLLFATVFYSLRFSGKNIIHSFKDIKRSSWLFLSCIIAFIILNIIFFSFPFQDISDGWEKMLLGKYISLGNTEKFWSSHRHGVVYPYILGLVFKILGTNPEIVSLITYISAICCVIGVFLLTYLIFNDEKTSLYAVFLYIFSEFFFQNVLRYKGTHIFSSMFSVYSALFIIMAIKTNKTSLFLSGFAISLIAANTRSELFLYTVFLTLAWILRKRYPEQDISARQKIVLYFLFACNLIITFLDVYNDRKLWGFGVLVKEFNIPFYIKYIFHRTVDYFVIWFGREHLIFLLAAIFAATGIKKYLQNSSSILLSLFIMFLCHSGVYIIFAATAYELEGRYISIVAPLFFPFLGYGFFRFLSLPILKSASNIILMVFLAIFLVSKTIDYRTYKQEDNIVNSWQRYERVDDVLQLIDLNVPWYSLQKTFMLVGRYDFAQELMFLTNKPILSFQEIKIHENKMILPFENPVSQIIYIHTPELEIMDVGDSWVDNYKKTAEFFMSMSGAEIGSVGNWNIYLITLSSETSSYSYPTLRPIGYYSCHTLRPIYKYPDGPEHADSPKMLEEINRHIAVQPQNPRLFLDRGVIFASMGRFYEAENDFKSAIKIDPDCAEAYMSLGSIYSNLNKPEEASHLYANALLALKRAKHIYYGKIAKELSVQAEKGVLKTLKKSRKQK